MPKILFSKLAVLIILTISSAFFPLLTKASIRINEIMYDLEGSDDKKEWVEIYNDSSSAIDLKDWRFNDGSNHILNEPPENGGRGVLVLPAFGYAILASDAQTVISNYSSYSGIVIDTVMSLGNTEETLKIIDASGNVIDSVSYNSSMGANGDGKTLQKSSNLWVAGAPTHGLQNGDFATASSSPQSSQSSSSVESSNSSTPSIASGSVAYVFKSEQISAKAGGDKTAIVGADIVFEGKAYGFKNEPLEKARYFWTLGDGSYKEGQNIRHVYKYTGNYIVVLNASSGDISASDRVNVKVIPNELQIVETKNEFIKLKNKSDLILDLSGWFLKANGTVFNFPNYSLISANAELIISSDVSGLKFANNDFSAEILYPNGSLAFSYKMPAIISSQSSSLISSVKSKGLVISQSLIKKTDIKLAKKTQSTSSATSNKNFIAENNLASVIAIGEKDKQGSVWWLILAGLTGIIGAIGIFLAKKFE